jgi:hypothetical protein
MNQTTALPTKKPLAQAMDIYWHPHPVTPIAGREMIACAVHEGATVREILLSSGIDTYQPIVIWLDDRLLTVDEWDLLCPRPGQIINVQATVMGGGGGGGGSNPLQTVAMIALVVVVSYFTLGTGSAATAGMLGLTQGGIGMMAVGAVVMMAGAAIINSIFRATQPGLDTNSGQYAQASPTYSLSGGSNRARPYESMPVIMGTMQFFPDLAAKPFTEYQGEDQYLYQIFHFGLSSAALSNWRIGTTDITSYTNYSWNYPDASGRINAFPGNVDTIAGANLLASAGWISRTSSSNTYRLGIDIEGTLYYANNGGGLDSTSVQLRVQYRPKGSSVWLDPATIYTQGSGFVSGSYVTSSVWVSSGGYDGDGNWIDDSHYEDQTRFVSGSGGTVIISGASQTPRRATLFIDVTPGTYEVRVIRDTADATDARLQNKTNWSVLRSYQTDNGNYYGQNRVGLTIKASEQLNGTIQQLSATAVASAKYWDGSAWVFAPTSNPAHWYMDFALGRYDANGKLLYGVGLPASQIDLPALHAWASFCDTEGLSFNAVIDGAQTSADILTAISRCGFGSPTWASGKLGVVWDVRNATAVAAFGMSNIIRGSFQVSYITEQLAEEVIVRFVNPDKDWTQDEVRVLVPGVTTPTRSSTIDLLGCTSVSMAGKFANYLAAQQYYRKRRIQWDSDFEGFVCQRGDVVLLSHDLAQWGYSGRLVQVAGNTLTFDRQVPRNGSTDYVMLKMPDGTMTTYTAVAGSGDSDTITLTSSPTLQSGVDVMDHMWFFSPLPTPGKKVKILSVQPVSESRVTVTATDEDPAFYSAWDGTWKNAAPSSLLNAALTPVIRNLQISERLTVIGTGQIVTRITIGWDLSATQIERVEVRYRINGGAWQSKSVYGASSLDVDFDGAGLVEAVALPINGIFVGTSVSTQATVYGKMLPPENVQGFSQDQSASQFTLTWQKVGDIDLAGYKIRWINGDSRDWGSANPIHEGLLLSSPYISAVRPTGFGTLMIKAVDTSGNESVNPSAIVLNLGDAPIDNIIESIDLGAAGFVGQITNGTLVGSQVVANEQGIMWNPNDTASMWHLDSQLFWRPQTYYAMSYEDTVRSSTHLAGSKLTLSANIVGDSWNVEYRRLGAKPMWSADGESMWTSDANLMWNIPNYSPWPGSVIATNDQYQFKISIGFGATQGTIAGLIANFDVPDLNESLSNVNILAAGTRLPITKDFYTIKAVNLTLLADTSTAFTAKIVDKNPTLGPLVQCFDANNTPVNGKVDALVQGY